MLGLVALIGTVLIGIAYSFSWFYTLEAGLTDRFFTVQPVGHDTIIIAIDEESLAAIGQWPWSRATHATLLNNIGTAKIVAFDVLFTEPSSQGDTDDEALALAIKNFKGTVVLPQVIDEQSNRVKDPVLVLKEVSQTGFVNSATDRDGVVRSAAITRGGMLSYDGVVAGAEAVASAPATIRIMYHGPATSYTTLSYKDVYNGTVPSSLFAGKTILVGSSAAGLGDSFQTPFGNMPGVEVHANTISTLKDGSFLTALPRAIALFDFGFIALLVFLIITRCTRAATLYGFLTLLCISIIASAYVGFSFYFLLPLVYQLILFAILASSLLLLQFVFEAKEKQFIRRGFEHYVAADVVAELQKNPNKLVLGGEQRRLSILFSDIRGFTTLSEALSPAELMKQLNEYLEEMSEAVMQKEGLVDKYIGDAVMAFWGAPLRNEQHAVRACESALLMHDSLASLNSRWTMENRPVFAIGVGISTGDVIVGNMGSRRRFNYSIIGDEVNFAARLEGLTKQYGAFCLIGETTYEYIKDNHNFHTRELDDVKVKGKKEPRRIYELLVQDFTPTLEAVCAVFATGRAAYQRGDFSIAIESFSKALELNPADGPSKVFLERSQKLALEPPIEWDGVYEYTTK